VNPLLDLHLHTSFSDGEKSPKSLVKSLKANNVTHFSITDHDNMAPYEPIQRAALENDMHTLPGIEISSLYKGAEVHILGYQFDWRSPLLNAFIKERITLRKERALLIFEMLKKKGYEFDQRDIQRVINAHYVGRPQIADLLFDHGYVANPSEAFSEEFIGDSGDKAIITYKLKPVDEVITIIKQAGGLVFLAHPGLFNGNGANSEGMNKHDIQLFVELGIDGLEVFHPKQTKAQIQRYLSLSKEKNLLISMGSDYHRGPYKANHYALNHHKYLKDVLSWLE
jgi:hypothetical protein